MDDMMKKVSEMNNRITKLEVSVHGSNGHGGIFKEMEEQKKSIKTLTRNMYILIGALMALEIVLKFAPDIIK